MDSQRNGIFKACPQEAAADPRGPEPACGRAPVSGGWHTQGGKGRANQRLAVVPSSRRGKNLQSDAKEEEPCCPQGYVAATWYGEPIFTLEVRPGNRQGW